MATQADYDTALKKLMASDSVQPRMATQDDLNAALQKLQDKDKNLSLTNVLLGLTGAAPESLQQEVQTKFSEAVAHGISQTASGAHYLYEKLRGNDDAAEQVNMQAKQRDDEFTEKYGDDASTDAGMLVGQMIPYMAGGEVLSTTKIPELLAKPVTKLVQSAGFTKAAPKLGQLSVATAAAPVIGAAAYSPDEQQETNAALSTAATLVLPPAAKHTFKGINAIIPDWSTLKQLGAYVPKMAARIASKASPVSTEDIQSVVNETEGDANPPLGGQVLQIPYLQKLEVNVLPTSAFSGQSQRLDKLANNLVKQATDLHTSLTNDNERIDNLDYVDNAITEAGYEENAKSKKLYSIVDKMSNENGTTISLENLFNQAKGMLSQYSRGQNLSGVVSSADLSLLKSISAKGDAYNAIKQANDEYEKRAIEGQNNLDSAKTLFDDLDKAKQYVNEFQYMKDLYTGANLSSIEGNKLTQQADKATLQDATFIKSLLKNMETAASAQGDRINAPIYNKLYKSVDNAIDTELDEPENLGVKKAYEMANANYAQNVVPLMDKKVNAIRSGNFDMDTFMSTFLPFGPRGKTRGNMLAKITKVAPDTKEAILTEALRPAVQKDMYGKSFVSAGTMAKQLKDIGEERLNTLTENDPNKAKAIKDFQNNIARNGESLGRLANQKTGYQALHGDAANQLVNTGADLATGKLGKVAETLLKLSIGKGTTNVLANKDFLKMVLQERLNPAQSTNIDSQQIQSGILKVIAPLLSQLNQAGDSQSST